MDFGVRVTICLVMGITFSVLAGMKEQLRTSAAFRYTGIVVCLVLIAWTSAGARQKLSEAGEGMNLAVAFGVVVPLAMACVVWCFFGAVVVAEGFGNIVRSAIGIDDRHQRIPPPCSMAEAAMARRDYDEAERLYKELAEEYPDEAKPCHGLAELMLKLNRPTAAMHWFELAEQRATDLGAKMSYRFAAADIMSDQVGDIPGAIAMIERFVAENATEEVCAYGEKRIESLRERLRSLQEESS